MNRPTTEEPLRITQFIFDKASIGIYQIGPDAKILNVNPQAAKSLGYSVDELCELSILDIDPDIDRKGWNAVWASLCELGWGQFERVHRRKDGSRMPVEITANLLQYEEQQFSVAFVKDITERKEWENHLKQSERRYQDLFSNAPVGYVVTDIHRKEPHIKEVNEAFLALVGYERDEVIGAPISRFYTDASKNRMIEMDFQHTLKGAVLSEERDLLTRDKQIINTILNVHPELDNNQTVVGMRAMYLDISDRKKAEQEATRLTSALSQAEKMKTIGTLAGGIAHDFNNILSAIIGYAQLAQMNSQNDPKIKKYIDQVFVASERAKELIQQILAFSRQGTIEKQPTDIGVIIKETLKLVRASIPATIEIQHNVKTNVGTIEANPTQIHQVILNLCTNAAHAMECTGGRLLVELTPATISERDCSNYRDIKPGHYLKLTITDTGTGVDPKILPRIFEPYFTTKEIGEGTGMGLALVHGIVKDHGGDIKVYSEPDEGTTFHILFPALDGDAEEFFTPSAVLPRGSGTLLFVDDEAALADIGKELLESLGYTVETRTSPTDALKAFQATPDKYDLVITDMTMPKMNGVQLAEAIAKICPAIPIIVCTGFSNRISQKNANLMGISSILMKPLTLTELAKAVNDVLNDSQRQPGKQTL